MCSLSFDLLHLRYRISDDVKDIDRFTSPSCISYESLKKELTYLFLIRRKEVFTQHSFPGELILYSFFLIEVEEWTRLLSFKMREIRN